MEKVLEPVRHCFVYDEDTLFVLSSRKGLHVLDNKGYHSIDLHALFLVPYVGKPGVYICGTSGGWVVVLKSDGEIIQRCATNTLQIYVVRYFNGKLLSGGLAGHFGLWKT